MRNYALTKITGNPVWEQIPEAPIDHRLWSDVPDIVPTAQVCWDEEALYVRLRTKEPRIRKSFTGPLDPVYEDSCLEFFFCPEEGDRYFNFEMNPNGAMYIGFGGPGGNRCRLYRPDFKELFDVRPFEFSGGWGVAFRIPVRFIQIYAPEFTLYPGKTIRGNFFKCGDETELPHFMSWSKVKWDTPCFHLPQFFGALQL